MILVPHLRPAEDEEMSSAGRKYEVTIYTGTDCKLYDLAREGELLARRGNGCGDSRRMRPGGIS
jgi:hypothetical protein